MNEETLPEQLFNAQHALYRKEAIDRAFLFVAVLTSNIHTH